jgi:hypothetical protein
VMLPRTLIEVRLPQVIPDPPCEQQRRYQLEQGQDLHQ